MAAYSGLASNSSWCVSTHSHPKVAAFGIGRGAIEKAGFNTQPPEGGCISDSGGSSSDSVSTHSHPKVAALLAAISADGVEFQHTATRRWLRCSYCISYRTSGFNTQPPEGGCMAASLRMMAIRMFQHTATRRWLPSKFFTMLNSIGVSTHSHPKVAARGFD